MKKFNTTALVTAMAFAASTAVAGTITIESWRSEDQKIWNETIIPAFAKKHPDIKIEFTPTSPTEYNSALNARLDGGTAGDLITCRPFDGSLSLYDKGQLVKVNDIKSLANFSDVAKSAWSTDDGSATFCMPMASVIHGFIYNKDAFKEVGVSAPKTEAEFFKVLDTLKTDGTYIPMAMGTKDQWEAATMAYTNIGPTYWKGEEGRANLIAGKVQFNSPEFVKPMEVLGRWGDYLGKGYQAQGYTDSQNLFTLGRAAIYPAGSWEINGFNENADFAMGAFHPPVQKEGDKCYISDHNDIGIGLNAASKNPAEAKVFLEWVGSAEFAELYTNALPGFFSLSSDEFNVKDPLAKEFISWRKSCGSTIRVAHQILSRGEPNTWNNMWTESANTINKTKSAKEATDKLAKDLSSWYKAK